MFFPHSLVETDDQHNNVCRILYRVIFGKLSNWQTLGLYQWYFYWMKMIKLYKIFQTPPYRILHQTVNSELSYSKYVLNIDDDCNIEKALVFVIEKSHHTRVSQTDLLCHAFLDWIWVTIYQNISLCIRRLFGSAIMSLR